MTVDQRIALINSLGYDTRQDGLGNVFVRKITEGVRSWTLAPDCTTIELVEWLQANV